MKIVLATCKDKPLGIADDQPLKDFLLRHGDTVEFAIWNDEKADWKNADVVLVRSTWDYYLHLNEFLAWAERVSKLTRLVNSLDILKWNSSKEYLAQLQKAAPIVPSIFATGEKQAIAAAQNTLSQNGEVILKPAVSASSNLTFRISDPSEIPAAVRQILQRGTVLIQPYISSIETIGEVSLIYFRIGEKDVYSHAIQKLPQAGEFRVQTNFGGRVQSFTPTPNLFAISEQAIAAFPTKALYTRVDLVNWKDQPMIGEIEQIEPELFFRFAENAPALLRQGLELF